MIDTGEGKRIGSISRRIKAAKLRAMAEKKKANDIAHPLTTLYYKSIPLDLEIPIPGYLFNQAHSSEQYDLVGINDIGQVYTISLPKRLLTVENPNE